MDLSTATKNLLYRNPFYGHLSLGIPKKFSKEVPTACAKIEGINIVLYFNEDFWNKLEDKHKIGLLQHELGHICLFHLIYWDEFKEKEIYNIAADMAINQYIDKDYLPPNGMLPSAFPDLNLEEFKDSRYYYDKLIQAHQSGASSKLSKLVNHRKGGGMSVCSHPLWGEGEDGEEGEGSGGGVGRPIRGPLSDALKDLIKAQIEHQVKSVYEDNLSKDPGSVPGYLRDMVTSIYLKNPPVLDWRVVVRQFKSFCDKQTIAFTRNRPNKRYPDCDAITLRQKRKLLVGLDTSGSISPNTLCEFFTQIAHMSKHGVEIDVIEWDAGIGRIYEFDRRNPWKGDSVTGGGGTNPYDVLVYLNKSRYHNAAIMFSDGFIGGEWTKASKPILWVLTKGGGTNFSFPGKKIIADID